MIGLLSLSNAENYGAVLQSLALCNYLNDNETEAEIIDFTPQFFVGRYKIFCIQGSNFREKIHSILENLRICPIMLIKKYRFYHRYVKSKTY